MANSDCPNREILENYLHGKLDQSSEHVIAEHLEKCSTCEDTVQNLESETNLDWVPKRGNGALPLENNYDDLIEDLKRIRRPPPVDSEVSHDLGSSLIGRTLGEYRLFEFLDKGGMGTVYKAEHTSLGRIVAIKVLPEVSLRNEFLVKRFRREMKAVGRLDHPNIVRATDAGAIDGMHFLAMELVDGLNLTHVLKRTGPLSAADACDVICQAANALQVAYEAKLVHRDIKPSNLMLTTTGQIKVLDLGLALLHDEKVEIEQSELTSQNQIMGTADYMAPEQATDTHSVDIRADIYSLGCTLFFLLTGRPPFRSERGRSTLETLMAHANAPVPNVLDHRSDIPKRLAIVVSRMLAKQPADRPTPPSEVTRLLKPFTKMANLPRLQEQLAKPIAIDSPEPTIGDAPRALVGGNDPTLVVSKQRTMPTHAVKSHSRSQRARSLRKCLALGIPLLLVAGIIFHLTTNYGTIIVEVNDDSVAAKLTSSGLIIEDSGSKRQWTIEASDRKKVPPGGYRVSQPTDANFVLHITDVPARSSNR
ncbi:MAG: serine/threonine-protein kinase [Pirellulaceae bacterium]